MPANFFETYRTIAAQHGAEADFLERLSGFSQIIETREKLVRDHPLTVRVSGYDLNRLQAICQATGASKTEVVCRLIAAAALFVPECDEQSKVKPTYKKTVKVVTRTPTFATKQAREVTPPPPRGRAGKTLPGTLSGCGRICRHSRLLVTSCRASTALLYSLSAGG